MPEQAEWVRERFARQYPGAALRIVPAGEYPYLGTKVDLRSEGER
jgi:hypothetical protein